jgi:hypothetical protein
MSVKTIKLLLLFSFFTFHFSFVSAWEFGMFVNQEAGRSGIGDDGNFDYTIGAVPRVTSLLDDKTDFIVSAGAELSYSNGWTGTLELLRTEFTFRFDNWGLEIGRMYHSDPLGSVASGLFDGVKAFYYSEAGTFSAGAWYTGLLYKKRTSIEMTLKESEAYNNSGVYFTPKRFLGAFGWEHLGWDVQTRASLLYQFDFSKEKPLHSQYAVVKLSLPLKVFSFDLGGCFELMQNDGKTGAAFAAEAGIVVTPPTEVNHRLSLLARYFSGDGKGRADAFLPFTNESQWNIFRVKYSGVSIISLDYAIRLHPDFSASLSSAYFIRNDLVTYKGYPFSLSGADSGGYTLGNELFMKLTWGPASDLQANAGAGIFMPSMGGAAPGAKYAWRLALNVVLSLF